MVPDLADRNHARLIFKTAVAFSARHRPAPAWNANRSAGKPSQTGGLPADYAARTRRRRPSTAVPGGTGVSPDGGFGVEDSGFGVEDSGFGVEDSGFGVEDSGFGVQYVAPVCNRCGLLPMSIVGLPSCGLIAYTLRHAWQTSIEEESSDVGWAPPTTFTRTSLHGGQCPPYISPAEPMWHRFVTGVVCRLC